MTDSSSTPAYVLYRRVRINSRWSRKLSVHSSRENNCHQTLVNRDLLNMHMYAFTKTSTPDFRDLFDTNISEQFHANLFTFTKIIYIWIQIAYKCVQIVPRRAAAVRRGCRGPSARRRAVGALRVLQVKISRAICQPARII
jgi:hypothetical protein